MLHEHLGHTFGRVGILTVDETDLQQQRRPNTKQKKLSTGTKNVHNKSESSAIKFVC